MKTDLEKIKARWVSEVMEHAKEVDSEQQYIWEGLLVGFLMGAGVPLEEALDIAIKSPRNGWPV